MKRIATIAALCALALPAGTSAWSYVQDPAVYWGYYEYEYYPEYYYPHYEIYYPTYYYPEYYTYHVPALVTYQPYGYTAPSPYVYPYPVGDTDTFGSPICYWQGYGRGLCEFNPRQPVYDHWTGTWY